MKGYGEVHITQSWKKKAINEWEQNRNNSLNILF